MPRIRHIKPETFDDPDLNRLPHVARWLFVGLWTQADRAGRIEDEPARLKARLLPYDDIDADRALAMLVPQFITRYTVDGRKYLQINRFTKHQHPHPKEPESSIPPAPERAVKRNGKPRKETASTGKAGTSRVGMETLETLGMETLDSGNGLSIKAAPAADDDFETFWAGYPRKVGKGETRKVWRLLSPNAALQARIGQAVSKQRQCRQWLADGGKFIPNPATWLRQQRWDDEPDVDVPHLSSGNLAALEGYKRTLHLDKEAS